MEELANNARASISSYCYTECLAYCCRRGYLLLSDAEVEFFAHTTELKKMPFVDKERHIFNLHGGCPNLVDFKCRIHTNVLRPSACKDYPLFISSDTVVVASDCPAVVENKLYPYLAEFKRLGMKIVYT